MLVRDISGWRQREKNLLVPLRACSLLDYHMVKRRGSVTPSEDCNWEWFTPENSSTEDALSGSLRYFSFLCCCSFHSKKKKKKKCTRVVCPMPTLERVCPAGKLSGGQKVCVHAASTRLIATAVPHGFSVAASVLEMATLGLAFKVTPKTRQLSPCQCKVEGLWTPSQHHGKHKRLISEIRRFKELLLLFLIKRGPVGVGWA